MPNDTRNALVGKLTYLNEVSLRSRLKRLAAENETVWGLLNVKPKDQIELACTYRDQLVHYSEDPAGAAATRAAELVDCFSFLATMVECSILRELGFGSEAVTALAERSDTYYLRFAR